MKVKLVVSIPVRNEITFPDGNYIKEFRLDYAKNKNIGKIVEKIEAIENSIITIRDKEEGGFYDGTIYNKLKYLENVKNSIIDIEFKHFSKLPKKFVEGKKIIPSIHRFDGMLSEKEILEIIKKCKDNMPKIAMNFNNIDYAMNLARNYRGKIILVDLSGDPIKKLILALLSDTFLYAFYKEPTGPGQLDYKSAEQLLETIKEINGQLR